MQKEYQFPCEKCGGKLKFSAIEGELKCPYCSHINIIKRNFKNIVEKDYYKTLQMLKNFNSKPIKVTTVKCKSCAATFEMDNDIYASTCPYCDSPIVNEIKLYKPIQPQALLPFKVTKKDAKEIFKKWLKNSWFAPDKLKQYSAEDSKLKAIYIPHWTYDSDTFSNYLGRRGDKYYVQEQYTEIINGRRELRTRTVEKIRWSNVSGSLNKSFDDVLVMATTSINYTLSNWDLENLVDYDKSYLSGYESEVYSIEIDEAIKTAKLIMQNRIRIDIKNQIGGDIQEITSLKSQYSNITYKHILLPVYASAFKFNNKIYNYVINARNGEIKGKKPYSILKISLTVAFVLTIIGIIVYFSDSYQSF